MTEAYILLAIAALMFSLQFIFNKQYQKYAGGGLQAGGLFLITHSLWVLLIWGIVYKFNVELPTGSQLWCSALYVGASALCTVSFLQAVKRTKVAVVTLFELIGGQLIPFVYSLIFTGGARTTGVLSYVGLAVLIFTCFVGLPQSESGAEKSKFDFKGLIYCLGTFVGNGAVSVATDMSGKAGVSSEGFLMMNSFMSIAVGIVFVLTGLKTCKRIVSGQVAAEQSGKEKYKTFLPVFLLIVLVAGGYAVLNGLGNVFSQKCSAIEGMQATVQFPILNSLIILFTSIVGRVVFKEKFTKKIIISDGLAIVGIILFMVDQLIMIGV